MTRDDDGTTTITVSVADQAQLHGVLAGLRDIGAVITELRTTAAPSTPPSVLERPLHTERLTLRPATADDAERDLEVPPARVGQRVAHRLPRRPRRLPHAVLRTCPSRDHRHRHSRPRRRRPDHRRLHAPPRGRLGAARGRRPGPRHAGRARLGPRSRPHRPRLRHRSRARAPPLLLPRPRRAPGHRELLPRQRHLLATSWSASACAANSTQSATHCTDPADGWTQSATPSSKRNGRRRDRPPGPHRRSLDVGWLSFFSELRKLITCQRPSSLRIWGLEVDRLSARAVHRVREDGDLAALRARR